MRPGDTIIPQGSVKTTRKTVSSKWITISIELLNQDSDVVAVGEALVEIPDR